jgi:ankyrin repeat protein
MVKKFDVMKLISENNINKIIKNIKQIPLDKPIHLQYYLIHYAGYLNRLDLLKAILKQNNKWDYPNEEGMTIAHIASLNGFCDIISYLINEFGEDILKVTDIKNNNILHYLVYFPHCLDLIKSINLKKYINQLNANNYTPLMIALENLSEYVNIKITKSPNTFRQLNISSHKMNYDQNNTFYQSILFLLKNKADLNIQTNLPPLLTACKNNMEDIVDLFLEYNCDTNIIDKDGRTAIGYAIYNSNFSLIKKLIDNKADINKYMRLGENFLPMLSLVYCSDEIINHILNLKINYNYTDYQNNTLAHIVLLNAHEFPHKIIKTILSNTDNYNKINLDGNSIAMLLFMKLPNKQILDLKDIIQKRKINIYQKNYENMSVKDYIEQREYKEEIYEIIENNITDSEDSIIELPEYEYANYNLFKNYQFDTYITLLVLLNRNPELTIPIVDRNDLFDIDKYLYKNFDTDKFKKQTINKIYTAILYYIPEILTTDIVWFNKEYYIFTDHHEQSFKEALKNKKRFIVCTLGFYLHDNKSGHANILIYDKKFNTLERFDPEGIMLYETLDDMDKFIQSKFKKIINTKFTYICPKNYTIINSFQKMSDEINILKKKTGDVKGFCQAWVFWYLEMRILNKNIHPLKLVPKLLNSLIKLNPEISILEYIRNYANNLRKELSDIMIEFGVPEKLINNDNYPEEVYKLLGNKFIQSIKELV